MISSCANPECSAQHRFGDNGNIFFEERTTGVEFFWLCPNCASHFDLTLGPQGLPRLQPRKETRRMFCRPKRTLTRLAS